MSDNEVIVSVDIGGTNTVIGLFTPTLQQISKQNMETKRTPQARTDNPQAYLDRLAGEIQQLLLKSGLSSEAVKTIGMGVPGRVDPTKGIVRSASNLGWFNVPFATEMERRLGTKIFIDNDVRIYTLGEALAGAGSGFSNVVCLTLGTGLAAGIMIEGNIIHGSRFHAGEIGHIPIEGATFPCNCGKIGCLETIASGTGIANLAREAILAGKATSIRATSANQDELSAGDVYEAAMNGDDVAKGIFHFAGSTLGHQLLSVMYLLEPEIFVIGGGVAAAEDLLLDPVRDVLAQKYFKREEKPIVRVGQLGDRAGLIGAAHYALREWNNIQRSSDIDEC